MFDFLGDDDDSDKFLIPLNVLSAVFWNYVFKFYIVLTYVLYFYCLIINF
jgi:hypothetical protein